MNRTRTRPQVLGVSAVTWVLATCGSLGLARAGDDAPPAAASKPAAPQASSATQKVPSKLTIKDAPPTERVPVHGPAVPEKTTRVLPTPAAPTGAQATSGLSSDEETVLAAYRKARDALKDAEIATRDAAKKGSTELSAVAEAKQAEAKQAFAVAREVVTTTGVKIREAARAALTPELRATVAQKMAVLDERKGSDREERAELRRASLKKAHGKSVDDPAVQAELALHAWRVARLGRLIDLAEASERPSSVERAHLLLQQEEAQHAARIAKLTEAKAAVAKEPKVPAPKAPEAKVAAPEVSQ